MASSIDDDGRLDGAIRRLVALAGDDAPPAPDLGVPVLASSTPVRQRWLPITAAAAVLTLVIAGVWRSTDNDQGPVIRPVIASDVTVTEPNVVSTTSGPPSAMTAPVETANSTVPTPATLNPDNLAGLDVVPDVPIAFTPLLLADPGESYWLDYAIYDPANPYSGYVRYRGTTSDRPVTGDGAELPAIDLYVTAPGLAGGVVPSTPGTSTDTSTDTWVVNGRTVTDGTVDGGSIGRCRADYCAVSLQWDDTTRVTVSWSPGRLDSLPADATPEQLLAVVEQLTEVAGDEYRPTASIAAPSLSRVAVVEANGDGVTVTDNRDHTVTLSTEPAADAVVLPDGRILIARTTRPAPPGSLLVTTPSITGQLPELRRFWPTGIDPTKLVAIKDAATIDGSVSVLYEVTGPCTGPIDCDGQLIVIPIDAPDRSRIVFNYDAWNQAIVDAQVAGDPTPGLVVVTFRPDVGATTTRPLLLALDGTQALDPAAVGLDTEYPETPLLLGVDSRGRIGHLAEGTLTIADPFGGTGTTQTPIEIPDDTHGLAPVALEFAAGDRDSGGYGTFTFVGPAIAKLHVEFDIGAASTTNLPAMLDARRSIGNR